MSDRYSNLNRDDLVRLLERRDAMQSYGLRWEREGIEPDRAVNDDYVVLDLDPDLSTKPNPDGAWRNLVIEGDNWDALRVLRLTYAGRIRCILIDPPYNTGNKDFAYNDSFVGKDDRFRHSLWLEFLYKRLVLARDLLADDGVILVCINDENRARLDLLMEQVFPGMRVGSFVWRTKDTNNSDKTRNYSGVHEHVLMYANTKFSLSGDETGIAKFRLREGFGTTKVRLDPITKPETFTSRKGTYYPIQNPETGLWYPCAPNRVWAFWSESQPPRGKTRLETSMEALIRNGEIHFPVETMPPFRFDSRADLDSAIARGDVPRDGRGRPLLRSDLPDLEFWIGKPIAHGRLSRIVPLTEARINATKPVGSWIAGLAEDAPNPDVETLRSERQGAATTLLEQIFGDKRFSFPKPLSLFQALIRACTQEDDLVLDFFAGSATTAHAVLAANADDDGNRRFIMVSNTEATEADPEKNICRDVCAARIRRVIDGYDKVDGLGGDFAYLKTRRIAETDMLYDLEPASLWVLLQLRQGRDLAPFDHDAALQISPPIAGDDEPSIVAYLPVVTDAAVASLNRIEGSIIVFTPTPGVLRDRMNRPGMVIELVPDRLLTEFRHNVVGV